MKQIDIKKTFSLIILLMLAIFVQAQITAPGADASDKTNYPTFSETDSIYIFCTENEVAENGVLRANTLLSGTKTFNWEKYNNESASFETYFSESTESSFSEINNLANGCYRVTITLGSNTEIHRAWVINNWISATPSVTDSDCESFKLVGTFLTSGMKYYDLADNTELDVFKDTKVQWKKGNEIVATVISPQIFNPPTKNTDYTFRVYDKFGCEVSTDVTYESIVTKAAFSVDPGEGEAPLVVNFNNESENGDPDQFEWFLFRNLDDIKKESEENDGEIDSIMIVAYEPDPVYTYEYTGQYMVKLVSKKISEFHTCVDTFYLEDNIIVDSSFVAVPNVFTPNGDGNNDEFVVKFWSMETMRISIFNRWGKRIHYYESDNIRGFEDTYTETVWDGKIGNRYASPGVYYYSIVGEGRDGKRRRANGFFHLFKDKD